MRADLLVERPLLDAGCQQRPAPSARRQRGGGSIGASAQPFKARYCGLEHALSQHAMNQTAQRRCPNEASERSGKEHVMSPPADGALSCVTNWRFACVPSGCSSVRGRSWRAAILGGCVAPFR